MLPKEKNIPPRYEQKSYTAEGRTNKWQIIVSPEEQNAVWINQDATFSLANLDAGSELDSIRKNWRDRDDDDVCMIYWN